MDGKVAVGYLGPAGTFSEEALYATAREEGVEAVPLDTIYEAVVAVEEGRLPYAVVPIENSLEGPVTVTLDTLAVDALGVRIVAEVVVPIHHHLLARKPHPLARYTVVLSHPQAAGQCARFLRERLPGAVVRHCPSTAEAVRQAATVKADTVAAIGPRRAALLYDVTVVAERIEDGAENETRFVWLARRGAPPPPWRHGVQRDAPRKTSVVFWGPGAERPGWLVGCLTEFAVRQINLTKIESRPRKERLGHYMFFADLEGAVSEARVAEALKALKRHCEEVRVLGSYPRI